MSSSKSSPQTFLESSDLDFLNQKTGRHWQVLDYISKGTYGAVFKVTDGQSEEPMALKLIRATDDNESGLFDALEMEEYIGLLLIKNPHDNVMCCDGVFRTSYEIDDTTEHRCYMLMELAELGTLFEVTHEEAPDGFTPDEVRWLLTCLANGLRHLKSIGVAHCDLKLENVLVFPNEEEGVQRFWPRISDFSNSELVNPQEDPPGQCLASPIRCTIGFGAPEAFGSEMYDAFAGDVYSLGVCLWRLLFNRSLFDDNDCNDTYCDACVDSMLAQQDNRYVGKVIDEWCEDKVLADLLSKMLDENAESRITVEDVLGHQWLTESEERMTLKKWAMKLLGVFKCPDTTRRN